MRKVEGRICRLPQAEHLSNWALQFHNCATYSIEKLRENAPAGMIYFGHRPRRRTTSYAVLTTEGVSLFVEKFAVQ